MKIGNKIATRRKELGLTQQELADKLYVSVKTISKWETSRGNPEISNLPKIAEVLNLDISDLFDEQGIHEEPVSYQRQFDIVNACVLLGFGLLGIIFFALRFITVETDLSFGNPFFSDSFFGDMFSDQIVRISVSGYRILFTMSGTNFLGGLLVLSIWVTYLCIITQIAFGVIEIMVPRHDVIKTKNKLSFIVSIVGFSAIAFATIFYLISSVSIGSGMILTFLLLGAVLIYNIKYKKDNL